MAVFAPMPSASMSTATPVKPGFFRNWRKANLRSFIFAVDDLRLRRGQNTKNQTPSSREHPSTKSQMTLRTRRIEAWDLEFLWCLEFGVWCFHSSTDEVRPTHWFRVIFRLARTP